MSATPYLRVAAGILKDARARILISERIGDSPFAGLWEFPGGKIGAGESPRMALERELREELGIDVENCTRFMHLDHRYPDRRVSIDFFLVDAWRGEPDGLDGQRLRWESLDDIEPGTLLPADAPVIDELRKLFGN